jgi:hypothetical protein
MSGTLSLAQEIQAAVDFGYASAAEVIGYPFGQYRPSGLMAPIVPGNLLATLPGSFSPDDNRYRRAQGYAKNTWSALVDGSQTLPGDYLVEVSPTLTGQAVRTFFIAAQQPLLPILAVDCNEKVTISRPDAPTGVGTGGKKTYGGDVTETDFITSWPASVTAGTKGEKSTVSLPGDTRMPWYAILLPNTPGFTVETDDFITTASGLRMEVSSVELTSLGWRLTAELSMT